MCHFQKEKATLNRLFKALPEEFSDCHASPEPHDFSVNATLYTLDYKFSLSFYIGKPPSGGLSRSLCKGWKTSGDVSVLTEVTILVIITCSQAAGREPPFLQGLTWPIWAVTAFSVEHCTPGICRGHLELCSYSY